MKYLLGMMAVLVAFMFTADANTVGDKDKDKPKFTISEVMKKAHTSGLLKKVAAGDAEKEDREQLAELYKSLVLSKPPAGDEEAWKKTTSVMLKVAVEAIADAEAGKKLKVNCGACHGEFKKKKGS
jgi:cytochrome c553